MNAFATIGLTTEAINSRPLCLSRFPLPYSRPSSLIKPVRVPGLRPLHIQIVVLIIEIDQVIFV